MAIENIHFLHAFGQALLKLIIHVSIATDLHRTIKGPLNYFFIAEAQVTSASILQWTMQHNQTQSLRFWTFLSSGILNN
jgi:hypothetical protein